MNKLSHLFRFTGLSLRRTVFSLSVILFSFTATAQEHSHAEEHSHEEAREHQDEKLDEEDGHAAHEEDGHDEDGHDEDHHDEHGESAAVVLSEAQRQMAGIRLDTLNLQTLSASAYAPGEIKANGYQSYIVSPRVSSVVTTRYAALGEHVKAGQPLVGLFSEEMVTAQSALQQAATEWFRVKQLGQQAVGEKRFVSARTQFNAASRRLKAFGLRNDTIDAIAGQDDYPLGEYTLSALSDGVVMQDEFNQGQRIEAGQSLMLISDEAKLWVEARLPAHNDLPLKVGTEAVVMAGGLRAIATITQEAHTIDPQTRTRVVRMDLNNLRHQFHAGMFADIYFQSPFAENVLAVPESALMRDADGEWQIFVTGEDGTLQAQTVTLGKRFGEFQQISGVESGVTYVSSGAFFVASEIAKGGFDPHNH